MTPEVMGSKVEKINTNEIENINPDLRQTNEFIINREVSSREKLLGTYKNPIFDRIEKTVKDTIPESQRDKSLSKDVIFNNIIANIRTKTPYTVILNARENLNSKDPNIQKQYNDLWDKMIKDAIKSDDEKYNNRV